MATDASTTGTAPGVAAAPELRNEDQHPPPNQSSRGVRTPPEEGVNDHHQVNDTTIGSLKKNAKAGIVPHHEPPQAIATTATNDKEDHTTATPNLTMDPPSLTLAANTASSSVSILFNHTRTNNNNNKRRHSTTTMVAPVAQRWDHFIRLGARTKAMVEDVLLEAQQEGAKKRTKHHAVVATAPVVVPPPPTPRFTAEMVRKSMLQVQQLQRKLDDAKGRETVLQATNDELRQQKSSTERRLEHITNALEIRKTNLKKAREDADAAEATAATLAQTVQSLQVVISETKTACTQLLQEHQQVSSMASNAEVKLIQKEAESVRVQKEVETLRQANLLLEHARDDWKQERKTLELSVAHYKDQYEMVHRQKVEQLAVEKARKERAEKREEEFHNAQSLLEKATAGQKSATETIEQLQSDMETLRKANIDAHEKLSEQQTAARTEHKKVSSALTQAELNAQQLRIQKEATDEELNRVKHEKLTLEQQMQQLRNRVIKAERELKEQQAATSTTPPPKANALKPVSTPAAGLFTNLPPLSSGNSNIGRLSAGKENPVNKEALLKGEICCICLKQSSGLMKACQCGNCQKRAHTLCVKNVVAPPSLSHPGTPAPALPTVLCKLGMSKHYTSYAATERISTLPPH